jgi:hypothetical protein
MRRNVGIVGIIMGMAAGLAAGWLLSSQTRAVGAGNDRFEDYILCTGTVNARLVGPDLDGVWLLDYRAGKLLGTVVNRDTGKISGWAEVDLVTEFGTTPRANVHFLMTTGTVARGQSALYLAEVTSGKFGVYTMSLAEGPEGGLQIRRHDIVPFRGQKQAAGPPDQ